MNVFCKRSFTWSPAKIKSLCADLSPLHPNVSNEAFHEQVVNLLRKGLHFGF